MKIWIDITNTPHVNVLLPIIRHLEKGHSLIITARNFSETLPLLRKNNIEPITSINKKLDPNYHQAKMEIEDDQKKPGTIIQEIQKGFTMKDRLLRPALVGVSKKTEKKETKNEEDKKDEENKEKKEEK